MSVYVVESGLYDFRRIWGVFTTLDEAREASIRAVAHDTLYQYRAEVSVTKWDNEDSEPCDSPLKTVYIARWVEDPKSLEHRIINEFTTEEYVPSFIPVVSYWRAGRSASCVGTNRDEVLNAAKAWMEEN